MQQNPKDHTLREQIQAIHIKHKEYGYPRMKIALLEAGFLVNHKKYVDLCENFKFNQSSVKSDAFLTGNPQRFFRM
ncbi:IS3 family transposase [Bacillus sp. DX1.1]|uniref:IS3 family transposase n=1 Tax=Bacillus sp. DX1.1 TaxID=3055866 RepID=UPI00338F7F23